MFLDIDKQMDVICRGVVNVIPEDELIKKLEKSRKQNAPLIVKLGCDPSRPDLHLGHTVVLRKLRQFQDLGHQVVFIIGDFTGMIGDPSGKSSTRPALTFQETKENGETYFEQASKVLDVKKVKVVYNSHWLSKMSFEEVIHLASKFTVARMLERDDFENRYKKGEPISVHEFLYPLAQAMDSVAIKSDIELGGTDQHFNLLVGRDIQREYNQEPQVIITMPIIPGTDGVQKMSKSMDNCIGISESAQEMYGKTLSIPDSLIYSYFELLTDVSKSELAKIKKSLDNPLNNPRDLKRRLAREIVTLYNSKKEAILAEESFDNIFIKKNIPTDIKTFTPSTNEATIWIVKLLKDSNMVNTNSEARRLIDNGGVSIDGKKLIDSKVQVSLKVPFVLKVGKRKFIKVESNVG